MGCFRKVTPMYERYTEAAKRAIYYALCEAHARGADCITPTDILMGLTIRVHESDCPFRFLYERSAELRASLELPAQLKEKLPVPEPKLPLDRDSKIILARTAEEASHDRQYWIDDDFLLRGVLQNGGRVAQALNAIGYTLTNVREYGREARKKNPPKRRPLPVIFRKYAFWIFFVVAGLIAFSYLLYQGR
jgi:hypothetical protein